MFTVYACSAIWLVQPVDRESQVLRVKPDPPSVGEGAGKLD